jgi:hypothetical protein
LVINENLWGYKSLLGSSRLLGLIEGQAGINRNRPGIDAVFQVLYLLKSGAYQDFQRPG